MYQKDFNDALWNEYNISYPPDEVFDNELEGNDANVQKIPLTVFIYEVSCKEAQMKLDIRTGFYKDIKYTYPLECHHNDYFNTSHFTIKLVDEKKVLEILADTNKDHNY